MKVAVLLGSMRRDRIGPRAANLVARELERRGHEVWLIDPLELQLPLLDRMYKEQPKGEAPEPLEELAVPSARVRVAVGLHLGALGLFGLFLRVGYAGNEQGGHGERQGTERSHAGHPYYGVTGCVAKGDMCVRQVGPRIEHVARSGERCCLVGLRIA